MWHLCYAMTKKYLIKIIDINIIGKLWKYLSSWTKKIKQNSSLFKATTLKTALSTKKYRQLGCVYCTYASLLILILVSPINFFPSCLDFGHEGLKSWKRNAVRISCQLQRLTQIKYTLLWQLIELFITPLPECFSITYNGFFGLHKVSLLGMMEFLDYHRHGHQCQVAQFTPAIL